VIFECLKQSVQSVAGSYAFPYVFGQSMRAAPQHVVITGASTGIGVTMLITNIEIGTINGEVVEVPLM